MNSSYWRLIKFDVNEPAPLTPAAPPATPDIATLVKTVETLNATVAELKTTQAGHIKRVASELIAEQLKTTTPASTAAPIIKADATPKTVEEANKIWEAKFESLTTQLETEKASAALATAISKKTWHDPEDAIRELKPLLKKTATGWVVPTTVDANGVQVTKELSLDEAVTALESRKPYLVKVTVQGGIQAGGQAPAAALTASTLPKTYAEMMANPKTMLEVKRSHPDLYQKLVSEGVKTKTVSGVRIP